MIKKISILGSTGSIGVQTLDVAKNLGIKVVGLSANSNVDLLEKQIKEFEPEYASIADETLAGKLRNRLPAYKTKILTGAEGLKKIASLPEADLVVAAIVGIAGLDPVMEAVKSGKNIALANKETLVTAGSIVMQEARNNNVRIIPVDSEHSAIFQCLMGNNIDEVERIILTASGGPFRGKSIKELQHVTVEETLKHPNWSMGRKITVDSATLMNKGLEVIEARWLFDIEPERIQVLIHPESVVHSMVEFVDGSLVAQLGPADMRLPIQFAVTYPHRVCNNYKRLDWTRYGRLTFENPDMETFRCLKLAYSALKAGGTMPAVMNGANEAAVALFLERKIGFMDIPEIIESAMKNHKTIASPTMEDIIQADLSAKRFVEGLLEVK